MKNPFKQPFAFHWIQSERGAAALVVTIVMMAIAVLVVTTTTFIGLDDLDIGYSSQVGSHAIISAESCVEETLLRLTRNQSYAGGNLSVGNAQCTTTVTGTPCGSCIIDVTSVENGFTRKLQVDVTLTGPSANITQWKEIN